MGRKRLISKTKKITSFSLYLSRKEAFLLKLISLSQRRTVNSFAASSILEAARNCRIGDVSASLCCDRLWDEDPVIRFIKLALNHPEFLDYHDQHMWDEIKNDDEIWTSTQRNIASLDKEIAQTKYAPSFE